MLTQKVIALLVVGVFLITVSIGALVFASAGWGTELNVLRLALANDSPAAVAPASHTPANGNAKGNAVTNANAEGDSPAFVDLMAQNGVSGTITQTNTLTGSLKVATAIANYFTVPLSDVVQLHNTGWGYGEIFKLYLYANLSGQSVDAIEAMRTAGMGWGDIAHQLGIDPGNHGINLGGAISGRNMTGTLTTTVGIHGNGHGNGNGNQNEDGNGNGHGNNGNGNGNGNNNGNGNGNGNGHGKGKGKP